MIRFYRLCAILAAMLLSAPAWAATYYVGGSGAADNATCSNAPQTHPCATISYVVANVDLAGDDVVEVRAGTYNEKVTWGSNDSGTTDHYVTLRGATGETVVINGASPTAYDTGIDVTDRSWVKIENITFSGQTGANARAVLMSGACANIVVDGCILDGNGVSSYGFLNNSSTSGNCTLSNSTVKRYTIGGVLITSLAGGSGVKRIAGCTFGGSLADANAVDIRMGTSSGPVYQFEDDTCSFASTSSQYSSIYIQGVDAGAGSYIRNCTVTDAQNARGLRFLGASGWTVDNSRFLRNRLTGIGVETNAGLATSNILFDRCEFGNNQDDGAAINQSGLALHDITFHRCWSHDNGTVGDANEGDGFTAHGDAYNIYMNYCVSNGNKLTAVAFVDTTSGHINNLTSFGNGSNGTRAGIFFYLTGANTVTGTGWTIKNSIGENDMPYAVLLTAAAAPLCTFDYNCYSQSGATGFASINSVNTSWATWKASYDTHSISADPLFVDALNLDFRIQSASPCINAGALATGLHDQAAPATDYAGTQVLTMPDIGAHEHVPQKLYFNANATGTWAATVYVQRSFDNGVTWQDVGSYTENAELTGFEPESGVRYRFGVKAGGYSSGTVVGRISQ